MKIKNNAAIYVYSFYWSNIMNSYYSINLMTYI